VSTDDGAIRCGLLDAEALGPADLVAWTTDARDCAEPRRIAAAAGRVTES
jgi:hypothetical protein